MTAAPVATAATAERIRTWPRLVAGAAAVWLLLDGSILFGTFPYWPRTAARWALLLVAGPALFLSLAGIFELAILPRIGRLASTRAARRIPVVLVVAVAAAIVALGAWWTLRVEG